jgi:hypothetical protein
MMYQNTCLALMRNRKGLIGEIVKDFRFRPSQSRKACRKLNAHYYYGINRYDYIRIAAMRRNNTFRKVDERVSRVNNAYHAGYTRAKQLRYYEPIRPVWRLREPVARAVHRGRQVSCQPPQY